MEKIIAFKQSEMSVFVKSHKNPSVPPSAQLRNSCWMGDLPDHVKTAPLCSLSIPGSHDSFTYSLERSGTAGPDQPECIRKLTKKFPGISCWLLYKWSVTQGRSLVDQLESGIRYFDIRLEAVSQDGEREFRILHCLLGTRVTELLKEIKKFLVENKSEIVILDFQHLYQFEQSDHEQLVKFLLSQFQNMLCSWQQEISKISLTSLHASGARLILIYPAVYHSSNTHLRNTKLDPVSLSYLWPRSLCPTPWPDTASTSKLRLFLDNKLRERNPGIFFISQGVLTPNWKTILFHPFSNLDTACGERSNMTVRQWLKERQKTNMRPNIVITDFVAMGQCSCDIINTIIIMNYD